MTHPLTINAYSKLQHIVEDYRKELEKFFEKPAGVPRKEWLETLSKHPAYIPAIKLRRLLSNTSRFIANGKDGDALYASNGEKIITLNLIRAYERFKNLQVEK